MTTYPLPTLAAVVTDQGISAPPFADILASLKASFQLIYGADAYLEPDSQDGQWLAVLAQGYYDCNQACIATYNQFSPATAQGAGLSSVVKINGIRRLVPTNSTVACTLVGVAGTTITNGIVADDNDQSWSLPNTVIPLGGSVTVTATALEQGTILSTPGAVTISTPQLGWQTAAFTSDSTTGNPVESDATLRKRQSVSTALPAQSIIGGLYGALANLPGVTQLKIYENDSFFPDANGLPPHSIGVVIEGGDATQIAQTIEQKKTPGTFCFGSTLVLVSDPVGVPVNIRFTIPDEITISIEVDLAPLAGYLDSTGIEVKNAIAAYVNSVGIAGNGGFIYRSAIYGVAYDVSLPETFDIISIKMSISPAAPTAVTSIAIPFTSLPIQSPTDVTIVLS